MFSVHYKNSHLFIVLLMDRIIVKTNYSFCGGPQGVPQGPLGLTRPHSENQSFRGSKRDP